MPTRRYEILLPRTLNDKTPVSLDKFQQTREELIAHFGAVSLAPQGVWTHEGTRYEDESIKLIVDVADTVEDREFMVWLKGTLLERFEQIEIYIVSYPIDIV